MKRGLLLLIAITGVISGGAQDNSPRKKPVLAVNFILNDFTTARRLQQSSLAGVLKDKDWARLSEMSYGLSVQFLQGINDHVDFSSTLAGTFIKYPYPKKETPTTEALLLEIDASLNLKLLTDKYVVVPYAVAGIGASMYAGSDFAANIPLGIGFQVNLGKGDAFIFTQGLYKIGVTSLAAPHFIYSIGFAAPLK